MIGPSWELVMTIVVTQVIGAVIAGVIATPLIWYVARKRVYSIVRGRT